MAVLLPLLEAVTAAALLWDACGSLEIITGLRVVFLAILEYGIRMGWIRIAGVSGRMFRNIGGSAVFGRPWTWTW